ncbi:PepSY domain-containing protein [Mycetocola reblochoni]|uniref:PepSY domain-containing protein n=2 Tax=Mycetocola reblochoni TaxID=331618 RepID=A0A1R4K9T7_9MICO|nr:PepSY domain-containing protein [Mycetocola reblochoni]RLP71174.1 hypothetical protein D9V30_01825 [Mycetocola reblochoni]SJN41070.1 hypothetical protein FM119_12395 [Mycetocola reblochoni REB411]
METTRLRPALVLALGSALALSACSGDPAAESPAGAGATGTAAPSASASPAGTAAAQPATDDIAAVVAAAEGAVDGSRAWELDWEEGSSEWQVLVVSGDRSTEVRVSSDGTEVLGQGDEDTLDADDRAEIDAAGIGLVEAVDAARAEVEGTVDGAALDEENGTVRWEVDIREGEALRTSDVLVDAASGEVLSVER